MTVEHWATEDLPAIHWDPDAEPPDDDTTHVPAHLRAQGIAGGTRIHTIHPSQEYL